MIEEVSDDGFLLARYTQSLSIDEPLAMLRGNTMSYYQADGLGSVTSLSDSKGNLASMYEYDSFGKPLPSTDSISNPFRFTGREFDAETGLYFYRARYYDPSIGRFISEDPLRSAWSAYDYCLNDPINMIDPFGLKEFEMTVWIGGSMGYYGVGGGVYNVTIMDVQTGESTLYTVWAVGFGVGLPAFRGSSRPVRFKVDDPCKTSASFEGYGYQGGSSIEVFIGVKAGGGTKIPHGPFIPGPYIGWERGGVDIATSRNITYWSR